jgi:hypothetical protein
MVISMTSPDARTTTPPYLPFRTFTGFLDELKETAVPQRIDNSVMNKLSGSLKTQMRSALKFMGLTDDAGTVLAPMRTLVAARSTPEWKTAWSDVFFDAYHGLVGDLDLDTGTLQQLKDRFKQHGVEGSVLIKAVRFYLGAMEDSGSKFSPHFKARGLSVGVRSTGTRTKSRSAATAQSGGGPPDKTDHKHGGGHAPDAANTPDKYRKFALPMKDRPHDAVLIVPEDMNETEWKMLAGYVRMYFGFTGT